MKFIQNVYGSEQSAQPLIIGKDTIYVHTNIRQEQVEVVDGESNIMWVYDEYQFPSSEMTQALLQIVSIQSQELQMQRDCILELSQNL